MFALLIICSGSVIAAGSNRGLTPDGSPCLSRFTTEPRLGQSAGVGGLHSVFGRAYGWPVSIQYPLDECALSAVETARSTEQWCESTDACGITSPTSRHCYVTATVR